VKSSIETQHNDQPQEYDSSTLSSSFADEDQREGNGDEDGGTDVVLANLQQRHAAELVAGGADHGFEPPASDPPQKGKRSEASEDQQHQRHPSLRMQKAGSLECSAEPGCGTRKSAGQRKAVEAQHFVLVPSSEVPACDASHIEEQQF
jgi:hypothetical protein